MLKLGCATLSMWTVFNLVPSSFILVNTMFFGGHTPALYTILGGGEVNSLSAEQLATVDSIAVYANGTNIAFCLISLVVVWMGLNRKLPWVFWGLLVGFTVALIAGVAADHAVGTVFPEVNVISALILAFGFMFSAIGLFRKTKVGQHHPR